MAKPNCSKCGEIKTGSYVKESWCGICVNARRKELKAERRTAKGLPPIGSGRDPKCKKCGILKEQGYFDSPWCRACKCAAEKVRYDAKCAAQNKEPRRDGRNPICKCGKIKECPDSGFCTDCNTAIKRDRRLEKRADPEWIRAERERNINRYKNSFESTVKKLCRRETNRLERIGVLIRNPCEVCGTKESIEFHHDDYTRADLVRCLCTRHHAKHHREERKLKKQQQEIK